jgi:hypothetical protein
MTKLSQIRSALITFESTQSALDCKWVRVEKFSMRWFFSNFELKRRERESSRLKMQNKMQRGLHIMTWIYEGLLNFHYLITTSTLQGQLCMQITLLVCIYTKTLDIIAIPFHETIFQPAVMVKKNLGRLFVKKKCPMRNHYATHHCEARISFANSNGPQCKKSPPQHT